MGGVFFQKLESPFPFTIILSRVHREIASVLYIEWGNIDYDSNKTLCGQGFNFPAKEIASKN